LITEEQFSRSIEDLLTIRSSNKIAVAVSGGADSMCLTLLMAEWAKSKDLKTIALTVDHLLRPESTAEAEKVNYWMQQHGIEHYTLSWKKKAPPANLQDAARQARYKLLLEFCDQNQIQYLALAHNQDDQFETMMQRLAHQSGPSGLAGIPKARSTEHVTICRPLLNYSRSQIIETLHRFNQEWIEDPSNQNSKFTRIKIRQQQDRWSSYGLSKERVLILQQKLAQQRMLMENQVQDFFEQHMTSYPEGYALLNYEHLLRLDSHLLELTLIHLLKLVSGRIYPPRQENLKRAISQIILHKNSTIHSCIMQKWQGKLLICREAHNMEPTKHFQGLETAIWDNRYQIALKNSNELNDARIQALGNNWLELKSNTHLMSLPTAVRPTLPSIWLKERLLNVPHLDYDGNLDVVKECKLLFYPLFNFG